MTELSIRIYGTPYCHLKSRGDRSGIRRWKDAIIDQTRDIAPLQHPCRLKVIFMLPTNKFPSDCPFGSDLDNLTKCLFDALNHTIFREMPGKDSCVIFLQASKWKCLSPKDLGAKIKIAQVPNHSLQATAIAAPELER